MAAPPEIVDLVERFQRNRTAYHSSAYNETNVRREFIDPLLCALGWDVDNTAGYAEAYKDIVHEDAIRIEGSPKSPDYSVRIGGTRKFFVEAKKPSVNLKQDPTPAYQLRRYAWSAKLPLSILTDFAEFAAYDCRVRPEPGDRATKARVLYLTCEDYDERWEELAATFSRDAVLRGSFDIYAETTKSKRGTTEVDTAFLAEIERWRSDLAHNIALRNRELDVREVNFVVQTTIDRIVFLRICEDRGLEEYGRLRELTGSPGIYPRLFELFQHADARYNSGLFHFRRERDREAPDVLSPHLTIDDRTLRSILGQLYYPHSPYEFSVIGADILGQVYEQFLGKVIELTPARRVKVEDKPEVKKAGGVYYTPTYVVRFIVEQVLGQALAGRNPERLIRGRSRDVFRVVDPACGSGSFLIGAYQHLLDWYLAFYSSDAKRWTRSRPPRLYEDARGEWRLTMNERKRILTEHVFGVDIDPQAVEVTKLSLLLKVLEGESSELIQTQLRIFHERALPDLDRNIKCGNSLVGSDFYDEPQMRLLPEEKRYRINVFDWAEEFPGIIGKGAPGFDAVIGNPPWGASLVQEELVYLRTHYQRVISRMIDSYIYFFDRATQLAGEVAPVGFIVPSTILNQVDAKPVRELLLGQGLTSLVSLGQNIFGKKVLNTSTVIVTGKQDEFLLSDLSTLTLPERRFMLDRLNEEEKTSWAEWQALVLEDPDGTFFVNPMEHVALLARLRKEHPRLSRIVRGRIERGVTPDVAAAHVVSLDAAAAFEPELLRPSLSGNQVHRYHSCEQDQWLIYTTRGTPISRYPKTLAHLRAFKQLNTCPEVEDGTHPYWALHRPRDPAIFASPKLIGLTTTKRIELVYDETGSFVVTDAMYVFQLEEGDPWAVMAILQSALLLFCYRVANQGESRVIPQIKATKLQALPFPERDWADPLFRQLAEASKFMHDIHVTVRAAKGAQARAVQSRQIVAVERQINRLVFELYGVSEEEQQIVVDALTGTGRLAEAADAEAVALGA